MIKTYFILLLIAALLLQGIHAQTAGTGAAVKVSLINQDPDPVGPGDIVELRFKLENNGSSSQPNVALELLPEYPFTILDAPIKEVGTLNSRQIGDEGAVVRFRVQVDPNADNGDYNIDVRYRIGPDAWLRVENFVVSVSSADADLSFSQITISPSIVEPGEAANLTMVIENSGSEQVKETKVKLDFSDASLPFAPFGSSNEISVGEIVGQSSKSVTFSIIAKPDAAAGLYKLPILLNFKDLDDNKLNKTAVTGVRIGSTPDILTILESSDVTQKTGSGTVSIRLVNKGLTDLRFLVITLPSSENIEVISSEQIYLGEVESDDFETADFRINVKKSEKGKVTLPLKIQFRDSANQQYEKEIPLNLRLLSDAEASQLGLKTGGNFAWLLILGVVLVAGIYWFFLRKRKRK